MANTNLKAYLNSDIISSRLIKTLGDKKAERLKSSLISICNSNSQLQNCTPRSLTGAAVFSALMNLSLDLAHAYVVPYKTWDKNLKKEVWQAQLQISTRGFVQLAHRTGKYAALNAGGVREGELRGFNPITGEPQIGEKISDNIVGYVAYMRLTNGFEKTLYMSKAEIEAHAEKYSQSYRYDRKNGKESSPWSTNFDAMASKTVLKQLLRRWGILSTEMAEGLAGDQSIVDRETFTYIDNGGTIQERNQLCLTEEQPTIEPEFDTQTGEVISEQNAATATTDTEEDPF